MTINLQQKKMKTANLYCQYGDCKKQGIKMVNYMNDESPQFAWMCEEHRKEFETEENECLCCKGTCDCEGACSHPHTAPEEKT